MQKGAPRPELFVPVSLRLLRNSASLGGSVKEQNKQSSAEYLTERNQSLTLFPSSQSLSKDVASLFEISLLPRHKSWPKKIWALNKLI
ncbi:hypothetical protein HID58_020664 [Brassica napus]|uniref:Uncharacterized protein n=1 Tax=Brassica napus TaxID=3708 RepID=A0ABQ8CWL4_BRANA|nr:hypothetical protein HID58_020664 [Brassica napus]